MADIIEFKPQNKNTKKHISGKAQIIEFPNLREYIDIYEKVLNGRKDKKSISNAFYKINKIVANLDKPYEKKLQIGQFVDYFVDAIDEKLLDDIVMSYKDEPATFSVYKMFQEDEIIDTGFELLEVMDDEFRNTLEKIVTYICFKNKHQTMIEYASNDNGLSTQIFLFRDGKEDLQRKAQFLFALFARSHFGGGAFIIHKLSRIKHCASGIVINEEGIFGMDAKELKKSIPDKNVVCENFNLSEILFS